ncbi:hypothetical protein GUITHDRAFT_119292 [Guillardia theta CCMP2712]|uniref:Apple domain-containing protein n=1 Tax=Guillardia theta (strain CCMP2712) TaxID=905079 RepID=L1IEM2_GUITC|nr:hypothetical protein GUITHDRAFT_119292 [Guillardia theta CCMP2712]EKX34547.1 hypothetical protein GUITHDRAFT_119292 [Guillardia theta CCMP2712]|eukprot:XP_005821527.1 hypothetical protein GUITHDRAFT_119292 [Guillardia theta CCMP2712]
MPPRSPKRRSKYSAFMISPVTAGLLIATPNILLLLYFFSADVHHAKHEDGSELIRGQAAVRRQLSGNTEEILTDIKVEIVKLEKHQSEIQRETSQIRDDLGVVIKKFLLLRDRFKNRSIQLDYNRNTSELHGTSRTQVNQSHTNTQWLQPPQLQPQPPPSPQQRQHLNLTNEDNHAEKDLALGLVDKLHEEYTSIFVLSLRRFSPSSDIVLFLRASTPRLDALLKNHGVISVKYAEEDISQAAMRNHSSLTYRWLVFERFLDLHGKNYRRVLLADVVQVAFQSNPFDVMKKPGLYAFSESISLSQDEWTSNWIRACFESSVLTPLPDKETLNVGYVMGSIDRVLPYVKVMAATIRSVTRADGCRGEGVDQGVHNVVAYTDASFSDLVVQNQNNGAVGELQSPFAMTYNAGVKAVINGMGVAAAVVLRYYHVPEVMKLLFNSYVVWDVHNVSKGTGGCWRYMLMTHVELFKGHGDFADSSVERVASPLGCCEICDRNQQCNGFTHFDQTCWMKSISRSPKPEEGFPVPESTSGWKIYTNL